MSLSAQKRPSTATPASSAKKSNALKITSSVLKQSKASTHNLSQSIVTPARGDDVPKHKRAFSMTQNMSTALKTQNHNEKTFLSGASRPMSSYGRDRNILSHSLTRDTFFSTIGVSHYQLRLCLQQNEPRFYKDQVETPNKKIDQLYSTFNHIRHEVSSGKSQSPMKRLEIGSKARARQTESSLAMGLTSKFENLEVVLSGSPKRKNVERDQTKSTPAWLDK